jgi:hypothetical protein
MANPTIKNGIAKNYPKRNAREHYPNLYNIWCEMRRRCYVPSRNSYKYYGARGIEICDEWFNDFLVFVDWAISHDYVENTGLSIECIDNDGNYEPSNCKWILRSQQAANRRVNHKGVYKGNVVNLTQFAKLVGVSKWLLYDMMKPGKRKENMKGYTFDELILKYG